MASYQIGHGLVAQQPPQAQGYGYQVQAQQQYQPQAQQQYPSQAQQQYQPQAQQQYQTQAQQQYQPQAQQPYPTQTQQQYPTQTLQQYPTQAQQQYPAQAQQQYSTQVQQQYPAHAQQQYSPQPQQQYPAQAPTQYQHSAHQQYSPPANAAIQQYSPNAMGSPQDTARRDSGPQSSPLSCYNCGSPEHWAQNCPEPRRPVPAGSLNNPRPPKRQKTGGPVITRYPPPSSYSQQQQFNKHPGPHRGYTHPPTGHLNFAAQNGSYGPPTPISASTSLYSQWSQPQPQPQPQPQQASPQSYPGPQYQAWGSQGLPTPASSYGSQYGSPMTSHGVGHSSQYSRASSGTYPQGPPQLATSQAPSDLYPRHNSLGSEQVFATPTEYTAGPSRQQSLDTANLTVFSTAKVLEPWMEELEGLDIPDTTKHGPGPIVWHPANPVGQPLPSTLSESDAIGPLPIAAKLPAGLPISKYFQYKTLEEFLPNIRDTSDWQAVIDDPAFIEIHADGEVMTMGELLARRTQLASRLEGTVDDDEERDFDGSLAEQGSFGHISAAPYKHGTENPPSEYADPADGWAAPRTQGPPATDEEKAAQEQEERLAALGVSGFAKPVRAPARPYIAGPEPPRQRQASGEGLPSTQSSSPVDASSANSRQLSDRPPDTYKPYISPSDESTKELGSRQPSQNGSGPLHQSPNKNDHRPAFSVPPPPLPDGRYLDGVDEQQPSEPREAAKVASYSGHHRERPDPRPKPRNGSFDSPPRPALERVTSRKRSYRESSEESDDGPKRQVDDITPKFKRRQPQVASAYSRRW